MTAPFTIGLVGAGPWATMFTGPMLAASPDAQLSGVWARRPDTAAQLAEQLGSATITDLDELIERSDAMAFSVPPHVQADLAARAARAGKAVLLDKPVGATLAQAQALAAAIDEHGVMSQVILSNRYFDAFRAFQDAAADFDAYGARAWFFGNGCVPGTYFGTPWRVEEGGLLDLGPHVLDALDAVLGPIVSISARGHRRGLVFIDCEHSSGLLSQVTICNTSNQPGGLVVELHGLEGRLAFDASAFTPEQATAEFVTAQRRIVAEFVQSATTGVPHQLDVHRGVYLQALVDSATNQTQP